MLREQSDPRWGDPEAAFPYCLGYEEYVEQMTECRNRGLDERQLAGAACIRCATDLADGVKVGALSRFWTNAETGATIEVRHLLYVCAGCDPFVQCPWWCDRDHEPMVTGSTWLEFAIHTTTIGTVNGATDSAVRISQHEDPAGAPETSPPLGRHYIGINDTDLELDVAQARQLAAALLNAADKLDEITGGAR